MNKNEVYENLTSTYKTLSTGMLLTFLSCMLFMVTPVNIVISFVLFILAAVYAIFKPNKYSFGLYSVAVGMLISGATSIVGTTTLTIAMIATLAIFLSLTIYVIKSGKDFSSWGMPLLCMLFGIIATSLLNTFLINSTLLGDIINVAGILVFAGFMLADTSDIVKGNFKNKYQAALSMHLNIVNLFLHILGLSDD